ncbi:MAG: hypothetical protein FWG56_00140 [Desulfovibrionaceae bacterium]|jgi:hypothetical protein|nr:hypothetical protein [Desulfovibrionaceae bacterium]
MAGKTRRPDGTFQYVFKRAGVLEAPLYTTFSDEAQSDTFAKRLESLLDRGIVPTEFQPAARMTMVAELVRQYERDAHPKDKDRHRAACYR